jgi:uncharacterized membrane protein
LQQIESLYPLLLGQDGRQARIPPSGEPQQVAHATHRESGVLLGFFSRWLVAAGRMHDATIVIVPAVGDFVEAGSPLFQVYGKKRIRESTLFGGVRFGQARTVEQDPLFSVRLLVDVAVRALSPAINDPYTAVQSLDRIGQVLTALGGRDLGEGSRADREGTIRLWYATPAWSDYVLLSFTEIRSFGASIIPVARRLRAVILDLRAALPKERHAALDVQLRLLDDAVANSFPNAIEREHAMRPDRQGIGASSFSGRASMGTSQVAV